MPKYALDIPFESRYVIDDSTGCWNWAEYVNTNGYGVFKRRGTLYYAHRVSFEKYKRKLTPGLHIDHLCKNRRCVNPAHLEEVSLGENTRRGSSAKLTSAIVESIRQDIRIGKRGVDLANKYGVSKSRISEIKNGNTW